MWAEAKAPLSTLFQIMTPAAPLDPWCLLGPSYSHTAEHPSQDKLKTKRNSLESLLAPSQEARMSSSIISHT